MKYPRYPKYKDSGVEWLGDVPEGWDIKRLKNVCSCNDTSLSEDTPGDYEFEYVDISNVSLEGGIQNREVMCFSASPSRARRIVQKGDCILSTVRTYLKAVTPIDFEVENLIVSTGFAVLRPSQNIYQGFLKYYIQSPTFIDDICARSTGVSYPAINASELLCVSIQVPNYCEQQTIAAFLDHNCAKIDALITEQEKFIALLREKRQAVIFHTVTKGLNPDAPMKDSGVEWLGEVPEGWEVLSLCRLCRLNPPKSEIAAPSDSEVSFLPMEAVGGNGSIAPYVKLLGEVYSGYTYFCDSDIIIAKITPCFENGKYALLQNLINGVGFGSTEFHVIRAKSRVFPQFLLYIFKAESFRNIGEPEMIGAAGQKRIPEKFVLNFPLPIPPIIEQQAIAAFLDHNCAQIDTLIAESEKAVALLKERRSALISAAVTGKIDVRDIPLEN